MKIIPVIDLLGGHVVRGVSGNRGEYLPIKSQLASASDAGSISRAFVDRFGFSEAYVADLDAIAGRSPNWPALIDVAASGLQISIDAGLGTRRRFRRFLAISESRVPFQRFVVGLESVPSRRDLPDVFETIGEERAMFSLDLKDGRPLNESSDWKDMTAEQIAWEAAEVGFTRFIVLDLAQVGTNGGPATIELCRRLRQQLPEIQLIAGGGIRDEADIVRFEQSGCDAVLVASALHDGGLRNFARK